MRWSRAVRASGTVFGVTYNYTGYPMVRQAREMVRAGALGEIRKVIVEYNQGWLATQLEGDRQQAGRLAHRPGAQRRGRRHRRHRLACREPGRHRHRAGDRKPVRRPERASCPGRALDDDASLLLRFSGGARGVLIASQIDTGLENDLRLRVSGTLGTLDWRQEQPNQLLHSAASTGRGAS